MIGFYALGGGMGHLTRVKIFIRNFNLTEPFKVVTNNQQAHLLFSQGEIVPVLMKHASDTNRLKQIITAALEEFQFTSFYIDTFPVGVLKELTDEMFEGIAVHYLGRRMKWHMYSPINQGPQFESSYVFERLEKDHLDFIQNHSERVLNRQLSYPIPETSRIQDQLEQIPEAFWLVVHADPSEEVELLIKHALEMARKEHVIPFLVVLTSADIPNSDHVRVLKNQEAIDWYPHASRIFSAAGFNTWHQLALYRYKHVCIPFERRFDDQAWRANQV